MDSKLDKRSGKPKSIWFYPVFTNLEDLSEYYYRCIWYLPNVAAYTITLPVTVELADHLPMKKKDLPRPHYLGHFEGNDDHISFYPLSDPGNLFDALTDGTSIALWKVIDFEDSRQIPAKFSNSVHIMDKRYPSFFEEPWGSAVYIREFTESSVLESYVTQSRATLEKYVSATGPVSRAYVFATGPTLQRAFNFDFSDGARIICNTIVSNKELLDHIHPNYIVAGDAAFHYGCSRFADLFREDLLHAIKRFDALLVLPEIFAPLMLTHYPQLKENLVALPDVPLDSFNFSILDRFYTRRVHNIMNQIMLPLASSIADEIFVIGADGRTLGDPDFLWRHDRSSYYEDLTKTVETCHPSYFEHMDWDWYYNHHCDLLEQVIKYGENLGKRYASLTPSFIPAFHQREITAEIDGTA